MVTKTIWEQKNKACSTGFKTYLTRFEALLTGIETYLLDLTQSLLRRSVANFSTQLCTSCSSLAVRKDLQTASATPSGFTSFLGRLFFFQRTSFLNVYFLYCPFSLFFFFLSTILRVFLRLFLSYQETCASCGTAKLVESAVATEDEGGTTLVGVNRTQSKGTFCNVTMSVDLLNYLSVPFSSLLYLILYLFFLLFLFFYWFTLSFLCLSLLSLFLSPESTHCIVNLKLTARTFSSTSGCRSPVQWNNSKAFLLLGKTKLLFNDSISVFLLEIVEWSSFPSSLVTLVNQSTQAWKRF